MADDIKELYTFVSSLKDFRGSDTELDIIFNLIYNEREDTTLLTKNIKKGEYIVNIGWGVKATIEIKKSEKVYNFFSNKFCDIFEEIVIWSVHFDCPNAEKKYFNQCIENYKTFLEKVYEDTNKKDKLNSALIKEKLSIETLLSNINSDKEEESIIEKDTETKPYYTIKKFVPGFLVKEEPIYQVKGTVVPRKKTERGGDKNQKERLKRKTKKNKKNKKSRKRN